MLSRNIILSSFYLSEPKKHFASILQVYTILVMCLDTLIQEQG